MGSGNSDPIGDPEEFGSSQHFSPACVMGAFPGNSAAPPAFPTNPNPVYPFYCNQLKMRLSGAYNNCEIFLLEISVSHLFGKIFSSIIHCRGLKIILQ